MYAFPSLECIFPFEKITSDLARNEVLKLQESFSCF